MLSFIKKSGAIPVDGISFHIKYKIFNPNLAICDKKYLNYLIKNKLFLNELYKLNYPSINYELIDSNLFLYEFAKYGKLYVKEYMVSKKVMLKILHKDKSEHIRKLVARKGFYLDKGYCQCKI
jgi:hypothetical protein